MKNSNIRIIKFDKYLKNGGRKIQEKSYIRLSYYHITLINNAAVSLDTCLQEAPQPYHSYLEFAHNYLFRPGMFAALQDGQILLQNSPCIFHGPEELFGFISELSNVIAYRINFTEKYFHELYRLYFSYLKICNSIPAPYNRYYSNIYRSFATGSSLYHIFMNPDSYFRVINGELFFHNPVSDYANPDIMTELSRQCKSPKKALPLLKALPKILDVSSFVTSAPCCSSNYSFNFTVKGKSWYARLYGENVIYEQNTNPYLHAMVSVNLDAFSEVSLPEDSIDLLYMITGGIKKNLDNFSMLCALIMTNYYKNITYTLPGKNSSPLSLFVVYAPDEQARLIHYYLEEVVLSQNTEAEIQYQLKDIVKTESILELISQNCLNPIYIPVKPSRSKESEIQIEKIKKLIQRKELVVKDRFGLSHRLLNQLPVICFVENPKQLNWLQANFRTKTFTFSPVSFQSGTYKAKNIRPLSDFLSIYGLKLLYDIDFRRDTAREQNREAENITECFIRDCLKPEKDHACYADSLYELYTKYYHLFYSGSPLTKICFTKELRRLLPDCQYKKPRHSRSDNRYALIGINVDREKASSVAENATYRNPGREAFTGYTEDMIAEVSHILHTLRHDLHIQVQESSDIKPPSAKESSVLSDSEARMKRFPRLYHPRNDAP